MGVSFLQAPPLFAVFKGKIQQPPGSHGCVELSGAPLVSVVQWLPFSFFLVAAPLKWSSQKRVPFFSRVTEQLSCYFCDSD